MPNGYTLVEVRHVASNPVGSTSTMYVSTFSRVLPRVEVGGDLDSWDMFGS